MRIILSFLLLVGSLVASPIAGSASSNLPFKVTERDFSKIESNTTEGLFGGVKETFAEIAANAYPWGIKVITIIFVIAALVMVLSAIFKNGQWQKYSQSTMFFSFISLLFLRGLPIIALSIKSSVDVDVALATSLVILATGIFYLCGISAGISDVFNTGYRLIAHPEFHRWSKNLRGVAALMFIFAFVIPWLFPLI